MKKVITSEKIPIKSWVDNIDPKALVQFKNLANLPFAFKHIAAMADLQVGYGMPIGGVMATIGTVIPNAVGVDIGCGMCAVLTSIKNIHIKALKELMSAIRITVPVGYKHNKESNQRFMPAMPTYILPIVEREYESACHQLGSLGSGNHFIEIQKGSDGYICFMIHSGSRNIGLQVANHYNKIAVKLNKRWHSEVPSEWQLAFLPLETDEANTYLQEMFYCVEFALANRRVMMDKLIESVNEVIGPFDIIDTINIAHNYAALEHHYGTNVLVHRKGATKATIDTIGIIPGSQGSASYIVKGKGNKESFKSCSHGAGRKLGRKDAVRTLNLQEEKDKLDKLGIIHSVRGKKDLEEAMGAYKDIEEVMKNQEDLVDIQVKLTPLAVIKG